jgi:DNA-binding NtrC family response regulator
LAGRVADYVALAVSHQRLAEERRRAAALAERNAKLENSRFNKSKAAKTLGLTRQQLYVRMRRYGLE